MGPIFQNITAPRLIYAGAIPFVLGALALAFVAPESALFSRIQTALSAYTLVIASFMAGVHWGQQLTLEANWQRLLMISSNAAALALWAGFVLLGFKGFAALAIAVFIGLLAMDIRLARHGLITKPYFRHRCLITAIVVCALGLAVLSLRAPV